MKIAVIGTGLMGTGLAEGMLNAGHEVTVYNRTALKMDPLVNLGAKTAKTPAEAIENADTTILVLTDAEGVRKVLLNDETKAILKGKKILNASTTKPYEIIEIADEVAKLGGDLA